MESESKAEIALSSRQRAPPFVERFLFFLQRLAAVKNRTGSPPCCLVPAAR